MSPNRLKELREARGVSLNDLAALVGTSNQQISHLELGKRHLTVEWLQRLAAALECHPWEIVGELEPTDPREAELLRRFRVLSRNEQDAVLLQAEAQGRSRNTRERG